MHEAYMQKAYKSSGLCSSRREEGGGRRERLFNIQRRGKEGDGGREM
jgi:hypothetical protein